jgi:plasmid stabilization system protein ParE
MSRSLRLSRAARRDIDLAFVYYEEQRPGLGDEFLAAVEDCLERIKQFPESFAIVKKDLRVALVSRFPYLVIYRLIANRIRIAAVIHASRHSRNWKDQG